jgi:hypothetical protein
MNKLNNEKYRDYSGLNWIWISAEPLKRKNLNSEHWLLLYGTVCVMSGLSLTIAAHL